MTIQVAGTVSESIVDGPGLRYALFVQGCPHHCPGCHNPQSHDPQGGKTRAVEELVAEILGNPLISGLTLTGGEPFAQAKALLPIAEAVRGKGLHLAAYSGYSFQELVALGEQKPAVKALLALCHVLVDGRFLLEERTLSLRFRGSSNQRCLSVPKSLAIGSPVLEESWQ